MAGRPRGASTWGPEPRAETVQRSRQRPSDRGNGRREQASGLDNPPVTHRSRGGWITGGAIISVLGLVVAVLTWLFPDPLRINDRPQQVLPVPASTGTSQASMTVTPRQGTAGTSVRVQGKDFPHVTPLTIYFHTDQVAKVTADGSGRFDTTFRVPSVYGNFHSFQTRIFVAAGNGPALATEPFDLV